VNEKMLNEGKNQIQNFYSTMSVRTFVIQFYYGSGSEPVTETKTVINYGSGSYGSGSATLPVGNPSNQLVSIPCLAGVQGRGGGEGSQRGAEGQLRKGQTNIFCFFVGYSCVYATC
jgi:hypothetical protein